MLAIARPIRIVLTLVLMSLMTLLSVVPGDPQPDDSAFVWLIADVPKLLQKSMHVALYGVLTLMLAWVFDRVRPDAVRAALCFVIAVGFGTALEWYQTMVPGRFGTLLDVGFDASGAALGLLALYALGGRPPLASTHERS